MGMSGPRTYKIKLQRFSQSFSNIDRRHCCAESSAG
jgi:hypothetical protein